VSLVGPSGSGKSSLLRAAIGLQLPLAGTVEPEVAQAEIGILFQDDALLPWRTARDNVALGLRFRNIPRKSALVQADYWLDRVGLAGFEHRYPRHLSGGPRKRVALAQVLTLTPKLLLMDEPFASLDAIVRARVVQDVATLVEEEQISVLLVNLGSTGVNVSGMALVRMGDMIPSPPGIMQILGPPAAPYVSDTNAP